MRLRALTGHSSKYWSRSEQGLDLDSKVHLSGDWFEISELIYLVTAVRITRIGWPVGW
jgi:hypothetical protein